MALKPLKKIIFLSFLLFFGVIMFHYPLEAMKRQPIQLLSQIADICIFTHGFTGTRKVRGAACPKRFTPIYWFKRGSYQIADMDSLATHERIYTVIAAQEDDHNAGRNIFFNPPETIFPNTEVFSTSNQDLLRSYKHHMEEQEVTLIQDDCDGQVYLITASRNPVMLPCNFFVIERINKRASEIKINTGSPISDFVVTKDRSGKPLIVITHKTSVSVWNIEGECKSIIEHGSRISALGVCQNDEQELCIFVADYNQDLTVYDQMGVIQTCKTPFTCSRIKAIICEKDSFEIVVLPKFEKLKTRTTEQIYTINKRYAELIYKKIPTPKNSKIINVIHTSLGTLIITDEIAAQNNIIFCIYNASGKKIASIEPTHQIENFEQQMFHAFCKNNELFVLSGVRQAVILWSLEIDELKPAIEAIEELERQEIPEANEAPVNK